MDIWLPEIPVWEIIVRAIIVFLFVLIIIRISGKRDVGEMSPADLILLLLMSASAHSSLAGSDKSILGGLIGVGTLLGVNYIFNSIAFRSKGFEKFLKGHPEVIVQNGEVQMKILKRHRLSLMQLKVGLRKEGIEEIDDVRIAVLEPDGEITAFKKSSTK